MQYVQCKTRGRHAFHEAHLQSSVGRVGALSYAHLQAEINKSTIPNSKRSLLHCLRMENVGSLRAELLA